jgi:uncharacterized protein YndB with AHSA1/START domain
VINGNDVLYELRYDQPPERVWRALTDPDELAQWLMPSAGFAAAAGRRFTMWCDPIGDIDGEVLAAEPPRRLAMRWTAAFGVTTVVIELAPAGDGTLLTLVHGGWTDDAAREQFDSGWHGKLGDGLRAVLDRSG